MSIVKSCLSSQAPLGAACRGPMSREPDMPLLTELANNLVEPHYYKHAAPDGAVPAAPECEKSGPEGVEGGGLL